MLMVHVPQGPCIHSNHSSKIRACKFGYVSPHPLIIVRDLAADYDTVGTTYITLKSKVSSIEKDSLKFQSLADESYGLYYNEVLS